MAWAPGADWPGLAGGTGSAGLARKCLARGTGGVALPKKARGSARAPRAAAGAWARPGGSLYDRPRTVLVQTGGAKLVRQFMRKLCSVVPPVPPCSSGAWGTQPSWVSTASSGKSWAAGA